MKKCRGFVSENGRLERHQYCPLEPCGVRDIDVKAVSLYFFIGNCSIIAKLILKMPAY